MTEGISSYEQLRLDNIKRNELELERLGLSVKPKPVKSKVQNVPNKRAKIETTTEPRRSSSRNASRAPGFFSEASQFSMSRNDDDDKDEDYDDDGDEGVEGYDEESIPAPTKNVQRVNKELALLNNVEENEPVIKIEKAKTGRSSCRKCRENIDQDTMRVGMKAWIMGRSSW